MNSIVYDSNHKKDVVKIQTAYLTTAKFSTDKS